jgi:hypothetical protein
MITKEEIRKICLEKSTIPLEKIDFRSQDYRVETDKSLDWISQNFERSKWEEMNYVEFKKEVLEFILTNWKGKIEFDWKCGNSQCDVYLPEINKAFKFLGLFEYSEINVNKNNQLNSYNDFENKGIHLVQIFEDSWRLKKNLVKNRIINTIGLSNKIWARKCHVRVVTDNKIVREFINSSHIQGYIGSSIKLGLFLDDEMVAIMTFGSLRTNLGQKGKEGSYELLRFCNKFGVNVVGGASKLFKYFLKFYKPKSVISYADKCWSYSSNCLYTKIGMTKVHDSDPSYFYIIGTKRKGRYAYRKDVVLKAGFDGKYVGEHTGMLSMDIYRIFDVGTSKFIYE